MSEILKKDFISDENGILIWNPRPMEGETCTWSGQNSEGFADGKGDLIWFFKGKKIAEYSGDMKAGKCHGNGIYHFFDGDVYEGDWQNGFRHGHGKHIFSDGRIYEGKWENDKSVE